MNKLTTAYLYAKLKAKGFMKGEVGAVDIVAVTILVVIAVALGFFFKKQIGNMVDKLFKSVNGEIQNFGTEITPSGE